MAGDPTAVHYDAGTTTAGGTAHDGASEAASSATSSLTALADAQSAGIESGGTDQELAGYGQAMIDNLPDQGSEDLNAIARVTIAQQTGATADPVDVARVEQLAKDLGDALGGTGQTPTPDDPRGATPTYRGTEAFAAAIADLPLSSSPTPNPPPVDPGSDEAGTRAADLAELEARQDLGLEMMETRLDPYVISTDAGEVSPPGGDFGLPPELDGLPDPPREDSGGTDGPQSPS